MHKYKIISILLLWSIPLLALAQKYQLSSIVTDAKGQSLTGANACLQGTTLGTETSDDGSFLIKNISTSNYQLLVSFSGCKKYCRDIAVTANVSDVQLTLKGASSSLYGFEAIGGVVNIITKQSKRKFDISSALRLSNDSIFQQQSVYNTNGMNINMSVGIDNLMIACRVLTAAQSTLEEHFLQA